MDPFWYIIGAGLLGACIGFFGCAVMAAGRMKEIDREAWREASRFYARKTAQKRREERGEA